MQSEQIKAFTASGYANIRRYATLSSHIRIMLALTVLGALSIHISVEIDVSHTRIYNNECMLHGPM